MNYNISLTEDILPLWTIQDADGKSLLHLLAEHKQKEFFEKIFNYLLLQHINKHTINSLGQIHQEAKIYVMPLLLLQDFDGNTVLHLLALNNPVGFEAFILKHEYCINELNRQNNVGNTPLHILAQCSPEIFRRLIAALLENYYNQIELLLAISNSNGLGMFDCLLTSDLTDNNAASSTSTSTLPDFSNNPHKKLKTQHEQHIIEPDLTYRNAVLSAIEACKQKTAPTHFSYNPLETLKSKIQKNLISDENIAKEVEALYNDAKKNSPIGIHFEALIKWTSSEEKGETETKEDVWYKSP